MQRPRIRSLKVPTFLFVMVLVVTVALTVLWNLVLVFYYLDLQELSPIPRGGAFHWTFIAVGSSLFAVIIVFSSLLGAQLIGQIRLSRRQSNFIASVSHELNSPLSAIKLFAQTLQQEGLPEAERRRFLDRMLEDVDRLKRLIANILRAAELDTRRGGLQVDTEQADLVSWLKGYLDKKALRQEVGGVPVEFQTHGASEAEVLLDPHLFEQVMENLVDNAIRYRDDDPARIDVHVVVEGKWVELWIRDNGIGIPTHELRHIFDRFYRIENDDPKRRRKGSGIGLFIVRSIVQAHDGRVEASSGGPGTGTTITIKLPLARAE